MAHSVDVLHLIKCGEDVAEKNYERQSSLWRSFYFIGKTAVGGLLNKKTRT